MDLSKASDAHLGRIGFAMFDQTALADLLHDLFQANGFGNLNQFRVIVRDAAKKDYIDMIEERLERRAKSYGALRVWKQSELPTREEAKLMAEAIHLNEMGTTWERLYRGMRTLCTPPPPRRGTKSKARATGCAAPDQNTARTRSKAKRPTRSAKSRTPETPGGPRVSSGSGSSHEYSTRAPSDDGQSHSLFPPPASEGAANDTKLEPSGTCSSPSLRSRASPLVVIPPITESRLLEFLSASPQCEEVSSHPVTPPSSRPAEAMTRPRLTRKATPAKSPYFQNSRQAARDANGRGKKSNVPAKPGAKNRTIPRISAPRFGLFQEELWNDPFWMILTVIFANKTKGATAADAVQRIRWKWPEPHQLVAADHDELFERIKHCGLGEQRTRSSLAWAKTWLERPLERGILYRVTNYPDRGDHQHLTPGKQSWGDPDEVKGSTEIGHVFGAGRYAYDSWRIFCRDVLRGLATDYNSRNALLPHFEPEWKRVLPQDKELRAFLQWMWLKEGFVWHPLTGQKRVASESLMEQATNEPIETDVLFSYLASADQASDAGSRPSTPCVSDPTSLGDQRSGEVGQQPGQQPGDEASPPSTPTPSSHQHGKSRKRALSETTAEEDGSGRNEHARSKRRRSRRPQPDDVVIKTERDSRESAPPPVMGRLASPAVHEVKLSEADRTGISSGPRTPQRGTPRAANPKTGSVKKRARRRRARSARKARESTVQCNFMTGDAAVNLLNPRYVSSAGYRERIADSESRGDVKVKKFEKTEGIFTGEVIKIEDDM